MRTGLLTILLICSLLAEAQNTVFPPAECRIRGKVTGRDSRELVLSDELSDERFSGISIPIRNDSFDFVLQKPQEVMYRLFFRVEMEQGVMRPIGFFPDSSEVVFSLHPMEQYDRNVIAGGSLNRMKTRFEAARDSLFFPMYRPLWAKHNSETGAEAAHGIDSVNKIKMYWLDDYFSAHRDLVSLSEIYRMLEDPGHYGKITDITYINDNLPEFERLFKGNPYIKAINGMIQAINQIRLGSHFPDFVAPTLEGKTVRLSDSIRGKYAVIDLWASWCGSCRFLNRKMIPVYEKYKNRGFTIVGVAREYRNDAAFRTALRNDRLPWLNLLELDNAGEIWNQYGLGSAGGCTFLVDPDGLIISIHPDAGELERILQEKL